MHHYKISINKIQSQIQYSQTPGHFTVEGIVEV